MTLQIKQLLRAVLVAGLSLLCLPAQASSIEEKLFLAKLLKHIGAHVCTEPMSPYKREFQERLVVPTRVDFRNVSSKWINESTGRMLVRAQARFHFEGGRYATHDVGVEIQPKDGMFDAKGPWVFYGDMDYDFTAGGNLGAKGGMDCGWTTGFRSTYYKIPPLEFLVGYKE